MYSPEEKGVFFIFSDATDAYSLRASVLYGDFS